MSSERAAGRRGLGGERLMSLDVLRGLTVAGMILVTDPGTYSDVYAQLRHAVWDDPTATDLIFPCFLVMVGISVSLSLGARLQQGATRGTLMRRVVRRVLLLIGLGLIVNWFPEFRLATLRVPGVLQRIGVCYFAVAGLYLATAGSARRRMLMMSGTGMGLLVLYWWLLKEYPTAGFGAGRLDPVGNVAAVLDRAVFTVAHMFQWGVKTPGFGISFDPEGILSTLGAIATTLCGAVAGETLRSKDDRARVCGGIAFAGSGLWLLSLALRASMPINKQIYTPTFALWSAGLSLVVFAGLFWLIDIRGVRRGWTMAMIFGTNAILAFVLSQVMTTIFSRWLVGWGGGLPLYMAADARLFGGWMAPKMASLAWAVCVVGLNAVILYPLYRRRIFLRL